MILCIMLNNSNSMSLHSSILLYEHTFFLFFRVFDQDGDGNISRRELKNAMISFGQIFSAEEAEEMFNVTIYFFHSRLSKVFD